MSTNPLFREDRFLDPSPDAISLIKIGEYVRTPLYEPSIRSMRSSLSEVRKQLEKELKKSEKFKLCWKASRKLYEARSTFLRGKFEGPEEYIIALICWTLDEPYKIYDEFNDLCRQLMTDTWATFPYKSLLFLLIQAEMRLKNVENSNSSGESKRIQKPITITSGLDYSIEEETEEEESEENNFSSSVNSQLQFKRNSYRVYRGFDFQISEKEFQPRNLVAFSHMMSATMDGPRLTKILEEKGRSGRKCTLVEIDHVSWSSRYIGTLSVFPVEKEVVIWPWIKFFVVKRERILENVEKIVLKPTSQSFSGNGNNGLEE